MFIPGLAVPRVEGGGIVVGPPGAVLSGSEGLPPPLELLRGFPEVAAPGPGP